MECNPGERNVGGAATRPGDPDLQLIERIGARDIEAFEELYRRYRPRLTRFVGNIVRRPALVEEVLNDALLVVWHRPERYDGSCKLSTWIFAIAYRTALAALRRFDEPVEDSAWEGRVSPQPGPEEQAESGRISVLLLRAIDQLSPSHRAVIDLTYFHEIGYREIAEIMNCPVDTVKTRMFHARRHLKRVLSGQLADWI